MNTCNKPSAEKVCGDGDTAFCIPKEITKCPITNLDLSKVTTNSDGG